MKNEGAKVQLNVLISVFLMLYLSRDTVLFGTNSNNTVNLIGYAGTLLLALYWIVKGKVSRNCIVVSLVLIFLGMLTMLTTGIDIKYVYTFLLIILAAFFCSSVKFDSFVKAYQKTMLFLAAYSIIVFLLYEIAYAVISRFPIIVNESGVKFINLLFDMAMVKRPYVSHRSCGIFREPGVYMIFLILALVFELFIMYDGNKKRTGIHIGIYILALALTLSTAGYIVLALVLMLYLLFGTNNQKHKYLKLFLFAAFVVGALWVFFDEGLFDSVFGKLIRDNYSRDSRMESINTNIRMIAANIQHVFTGLGFSFVEGNFRYYSIDSSMGDNTNTVFRMLATYGIVYIAILMVLWFKFFAKHKNKLLAGGLFGAFVLCLFNESLIVNVILYILAFYSFNDTFNAQKSVKPML